MSTLGVTVRMPRFRRRLLAVSEVLAVVAAAIALLSVTTQGPIRLMAFMVVGQPFILLGVVCYAAVALAEFFGSHGVSRERFDAGEVIFREGDPGDRMYAIIQGEVEILREEPGKGETVLARLGPGQYFGEIALVSTGPRVATVRTLTPVELAVMGRSDFAALYAYLPYFHKSVEQLVSQRHEQWGTPEPPKRDDVP